MYLCSPGTRCAELCLLLKRRRAIAVTMGRSRPVTLRGPGSVLAVRKIRCPEVVRLGRGAVAVAACARDLSHRRFTRPSLGIVIGLCDVWSVTLIFSRRRPGRIPRGRGRRSRDRILAALLPLSHDLFGSQFGRTVIVEKLNNFLGYLNTF